jgi:hypothetical protein
MGSYFYNDTHPRAIAYPVHTILDKARLRCSRLLSLTLLSLKMNPSPFHWDNMLRAEGNYEMLKSVALSSPYRPYIATTIGSGDVEYHTELGVYHS